MHPKTLLDSLRWKEDMAITNHANQRVWLGPLFNEQGKQIGITECCFEALPCEWHEVLATALGREPCNIIGEGWIFFKAHCPDCLGEWTQIQENKDSCFDIECPHCGHLVGEKVG